MTLRLILMASLVLAVFGAIWLFVVIPAQKKDHQRRLDLLQKKLEKREQRNNETDAHEDDT